MVSELSAEQRILSDTQQVIKQQVVRDLKIRGDRFERILYHSPTVESEPYDSSAHLVLMLVVKQLDKTLTRTSMSSRRGLICISYYLSVQ